MVGPRRVELVLVGIGIVVAPQDWKDLPGFVGPSVFPLALLAQTSMQVYDGLRASTAPQMLTSGGLPAQVETSSMWLGGKPLRRPGSCRGTSILCSGPAYVQANPSWR